MTQIRTTRSVERGELSTEVKVTASSDAVEVELRDATHAFGEPTDGAESPIWLYLRAPRTDWSDDLEFTAEMNPGVLADLIAALTAAQAAIQRVAPRPQAAKRTKAGASRPTPRRLGARALAVR